MAHKKDRTYLVSSEVGAILGVSPKTVVRWAGEGKIPFTRTIGGHTRYNEQEIRALLADQTVEATDPPDLS